MLWAITAMLTYLCHCGESAEMMILRICFNFWWVRPTIPIVCACFTVACLIFIPADSIRELNNSDVNVDLLSV